MNNVNIIPQNSCTGCGGCSLVCPKKAIKIVRSDEGFYRPLISEKCIECGICKSVCFKFYNSSEGIDINKTMPYLAYNKDDKIREKASSGGIGEEICKYAIEKGYQVCGVVYDYENSIAKHIVTDNLKDIDKIVGSKYLPSFTEEALLKLKINKKYIIIGTPCQNYAIRQFMQLNNINDWILVDFFCHGGASLNLWDKYLNTIEINNIKKISFRDKRINWHEFSMTIENDSEEYSKSLKNDIFLQSFLKNVDLQEKCYNCELRFDKLYSDIRLGDFWGRKCSNDTKGSSLVLVNTKNGSDFFNELNGIYKEEVTINDVYDSQFTKGIHVPKEKYEFQKRLKTNEDLKSIYRDLVVPIERKNKITKILKIPLRVLNKLKGR